MDAKCFISKTCVVSFFQQMSSETSTALSTPRSTKQRLLRHKGLLLLRQRQVKMAATPEAEVGEYHSSWTIWWGQAQTWSSKFEGVRCSAHALPMATSAFKKILTENAPFFLINAVRDYHKSITYNGTFLLDKCFFCVLGTSLVYYPLLSTKR